MYLSLSTVRLKKLIALLFIKLLIKHKIETLLKFYFQR